MTEETRPRDESPPSDEEFLKKLGQRVRAQRVGRKWRQVDLAERAGLSRSRLGRIETGKLARLPLVELRAVARELDVGLGYLVVGEDHPVRSLLRDPQPGFEQRCLVGLAAVGLASRLLHDTCEDPAALEDMARALRHCRGESLSRAVMEAWLQRATEPEDS